MTVWGIHLGWKGDAPKGDASHELSPLSQVRLCSARAFRAGLLITMSGIVIIFLDVFGKFWDWVHQAGVLAIVVGIILSLMAGADLAWDVLDRLHEEE
jgi:hypothetical protein